MSTPRVAVVTGSNRGIGFATVRALLKQFTGDVYLTSRNQERGEDAVKSLNGEGLHPKFHVLDTSDEDSITSLKDHIVQEYGGIDVLVHNVGILFRAGDPASIAERARISVKVNYLDVGNVCKTFLPVMKPNGRLVIISSGQSVVSFRGCSKENQDFFNSPDITEEQLTAKLNDFVISAEKGTTKAEGFQKHAYGMSKLGVNVLTRILAKQTVKGWKRHLGELLLPRMDQNRYGWFLCMVHC